MGDLVHSASGSVPAAPWGPFSANVKAAARQLTAAERRYVLDGCIHGDCRPRTIQSLKSKAMFFLYIDSPNGRWGTMRLTPLGENVRTLLMHRARTKKVAA